MKRMNDAERNLIEFNKKSLLIKVKNINDNRKYHALIEKIISTTIIPHDLHKYIKSYIGYRPVHMYDYK